MAFKLAEAFVQFSQRGMTGLEGTIGRVTGAFRGLAATALNATGIVGGLGTGFGAFKALQLAAEAEQVEVALEVMLGSAAQARKMLKELYDFGAKTPFEFTGLANAAKTLLSFGVEAEKIMPTLDMLSNIASGDENKLKSIALVFGQIASTGRLMGQDLLQLINVGFNPLQQIADRTGESMAQLKKRMEQGKISFAEVEGAFIDATAAGGRFYGMNDRQSKTLLGVWSTLKDNIGQAMIKIGKSIAENLDLKAIVERTSSWVQEMASIFDVLSSNWEGTWEMMKLSAVAAMQEIGAMVKQAGVEWFAHLGDKFKAGFEGFGFIVKHGFVEEAGKRYEAMHQEIMRLSAKWDQMAGAGHTPQTNATMAEIGKNILAIGEAMTELENDYKTVVQLRDSTMSWENIINTGRAASEPTRQLIADMFRKQQEARRKVLEKQAADDEAAIRTEQLKDITGRANIGGIGNLAFGLAMPVALSGIMAQAQAQAEKRHGTASHMDAAGFARNVQETILNDRARKMEKLAADHLKAAVDLLTLMNGGIEIKKMPPINVGFG